MRNGYALLLIRLNNSTVFGSAISRSHVQKAMSLASILAFTCIFCSFAGTSTFARVHASTMHHFPAWCWFIHAHTFTTWQNKRCCTQCNHRTITYFRDFNRHYYFLFNRWESSPFLVRQGTSVDTWRIYLRITSTSQLIILNLTVFKLYF